VLPEAPPDHSTISRTRRLIDLETHEAVFTWMLQRLADAGLVKGKTVGIDATTLEANAALRSIVRRDTGESYHDFLTKLAQVSGIETPTRADLARIDRTRKKKGSNDDWTHPHDPDAKITKMKDGRTHLAHKAEHAVDLDTGAIVGVTIQDADDGDTTTSIETLIEAAEQVEAVQPEAEGIKEVVGDKGYQSNQSLVDLEAVRIRSYISEPDRGRRNWKKNPEARDAVYRNRRRIRSARGLRLLRLRGERLERPFAHLYETGGMRRVYLRGHANIRKRLLIHVSGFNLGLVMRQLIGVGTPRGLQGRVLAVLVALIALIRGLWRPLGYQKVAVRLFLRPGRMSIAQSEVSHKGTRTLVFTNGLLGCALGPALRRALRRALTPALGMTPAQIRNPDSKEASTDPRHSAVICARLHRTGPESCRYMSCDATTHVFARSYKFAQLSHLRDRQGMAAQDSERALFGRAGIPVGVRCASRHRSHDGVLRGDELPAAVHRSRGLARGRLRLPELQPSEPAHSR